MAERVRIARMGHRGDGVVETEAGLLHVPGSLPGEIVEVEIIPGISDRRRPVGLDVASPDRIAPVCPYFGSCGGCAVQHWTPERYRSWKRSLVIDTLRHAGLEAHVEDLIDAHGNGRRRAVLHARSGTRGTVEVGFAASRSHQVIPIARCPVLAPELSEAAEVAREIAHVLAPEGKPLDIALTAADNGLDADIRGCGPLRPSTLSRLAQLANARQLARLTRHGELVAQRTPPIVRIGRAAVMLPPGAFLQATAEGEMQLARLVAEHVGTLRLLADLFAGIGPFALRLAEQSRVLAVDADAAAVAALASAARTTLGLKPVAAEHRDLFRRPLTRSELARFDAVVLDPPRQGALAQSVELAGSMVPVVIAVSCQPATFARDARVLRDGGYRLERVTPVDQFRYSPHVEVVARFSRA